MVRADIGWDELGWDEDVARVGVIYAGPVPEPTNPPPDEHSTTAPDVASRPSTSPGASLSPLTRAIRSGLCSDDTHGAVVPPVYLSTNFTFEGLGRPRAYDYSRSGNPTRDQLADALAALEGGAGATVVSTGLAAITLCVEALVPMGGRVVAPHDCYGGTWRLFSRLAATGRLVVDFVDLTSPDAVTFADADLVWIETPSNPLLRITDIRAVAAAGHAAGAVVVADNTFCSPLRQRPLALGCDVVIHSTTKFINGHSDVVGGAAIAASSGLDEALRGWANVLGLTGSPFDSFLTLRGLRSLDARLRVHEANTAAIIGALTSHDAVLSVNYPGLPTHPGHAIAARQQSGFGSLLSFELADRDAVVRFLDGLHIFDLAESLGGIESLVAHPATMTHASMTPEARESAGIHDGLLRLSVGIEDEVDLVHEVRAALDRALAPA